MRWDVLALCVSLRMPYHTISIFKASKLLRVLVLDNEINFAFCEKKSFHVLVVEKRFNSAFCQKNFPRRTLKLSDLLQ